MMAYGMVVADTDTHLLVTRGERATFCGKTASRLRKTAGKTMCKPCEEREESALRAASALTSADTSEILAAPSASKRNGVHAMSTNDAATSPLLEEIEANIERVQSLAEAENVEGVAELVEETRTLIGQIKGRGSAATKKELNEQLTAASQAVPAEPEKVITGTVATLETRDYKTVEGINELIEKGVNGLTEGVRLHLRASDTARSTAEVLLQMRLKMTDKTGAPDIAAKSQAARDAAAAMYDAVRESNGLGLEDTFENRETVKRLVRSVQRQMSQVLVDYVRALDSNPEEAAKFAKAIEANPEVTPSEAVFAYYGLNSKSQSEIAAEREAEKRALAAGAQATATVTNPEEGDGEGGEGGEGGAPEVEPDTYATAVAHKLAKATKGINIDMIGEASSDVKKAVRSELEEQLEILKSMIGATL